MRCQWQELMAILPNWLRNEINGLEGELVQELRLRLGMEPELTIAGKTRWLSGNVSREDILTCVNTASRYSPWAAATAAKGYITAPGGHRIGLCGDAVVRDGEMTGIRELTSIHIRVARDIPDIAAGIQCGSNTLVIGPPGSGKTTLLRDLIRRISNGGSHVSVVDERRELFPPNAYPTGRCTDILSGCGKAEGIDAVLRSMGPDWIAVDEITAEQDCDALLRAGWCGVGLLATAHAASIEDLQTRSIYSVLMKYRLFPNVVVLKPDKSWTQERMDI